MHNTLVHALEGPGPKAGTQKERWGSGLDKSVVHAQESCACTRILIRFAEFSTCLGTSFGLMHNTPFYACIIINVALENVFP